jgi:hypothetical protein
VYSGALTFIAPNFWTFTKIGKTGRCGVENYCGKTMTRASAQDLWGTFLGCIKRVWVCSMVSVSKSAVTRAPIIALQMYTKLAHLAPPRSLGQ